MENKEIEVAYILGAGFSAALGYPVQEQITNKVLNIDNSIKDENRKKIDDAITKNIRSFMHEIFNVSDVEDTENLPELEEIFTFIDMSAGNGVNLGKNYTPGKLRALRRMQIYKVFSVLDSSHNRVNENGGEKKFIEKLKQNGAVITLNWDGLLEKVIQDNEGAFDYQLDIRHATSGSDEKSFINTDMKKIPIIKIHGSINWLICDNCKQLFYRTEDKLAYNNFLGIYVEDIKRFHLPGTTPQELKNAIREVNILKKCECCDNSLGTHIATCSYIKSFRTSYFSEIWKNAEKTLQQAKKWVFIGYSLPDADYQFKHLLKCAEKAYDNIKEIDVVLYDDINAEIKYKKLFGSNNENVKIYQDGFEDYVNKHL